MRLSYGTAIVSGSAVAVVAAFLAFGVGGAGHGWTTPFIVTPLVFLAYPIALARLVNRLAETISVEIWLLLMAVAADFFLVRNISRDEYGYFLKSWEFGPWTVVGWLALWCAWQLLPVVTIFRNLENARRQSNRADADSWN